MRKSFLPILIIISLLFLSCSEDFNINAPKKDVYVLNCILQNENTIQYALLTKNVYTDNGAAPATIPDDRYIKNAVVKIFYNNSVYLLRDTTIQGIGNSSTTSLNCYYIKNLVINPGTSISIEAITPDGTKLQSTAKIPEIKFPNYYFRIPGVFMTGFEFLTVYYWSWNTIESFISLPQLNIQYKKFENGKYIGKESFIPLYNGTMMVDGITRGIPVQPSVNVACEFSLADLNRTMKAISGDDPLKSNYTITGVQFYVTGLDPSLSRYYTGINTFENSFTIKIRPTDYSNVVGGLGVFGVRYKYTNSFAVDSVYVRSFGYKYQPQ
jgi:hypothetical protein